MNTLPDLRLLDTCVWQSLCGPHRAFSLGTSTARRFAPGFSPIIAFADPANPDWDALASICAPGEHFYCAAWQGVPPTGWSVDVDSAMSQLVWQGGMPETEANPGWVALDARSAPEMLDLATRLQPGPFGLRTIELGDYLGYFDHGRLVSMAGERFWAGSFREISAVCTDPAYQGRGLARRLMLELIRRHQQRGLTSFLHVMRDNLRARQMYERMGFVVYRELGVRVVTRLASSAAPTPASLGHG